jgi:SAM-dependent methyltransferase
VEQDRVNRRVYHSAKIASWYTSRGLTDAETAALLKYQPAFAGRDVLDLGVGTGRTTWFLEPLARRYVAVDYSPAMVEHVRVRMPEIEVQQADMRDLSPFAAGTFDFILASNNVIDALSPGDRLRALDEAHRVLRPGGIFVFSSHNRSVPASLRGPTLARSRNPVTQARHLLSYGRSLVNHAKLRGLRRFEDEYALLNDIGHDYGVLHYYIDRDSQRKQLEQNGFRLLDVLAASGRLIRDSEEDTQSSSLHYVCERA